MKYALVAICLLASPVAADPDKATAEASFVAAKELEKAGKIAEACAAYETSYRADPALGALLNLANCHETLGRTATAWAEFREAVGVAARKGDQRSEFAQRRADALAPRLVRLQIDAPSGVAVHRNTVDVTAMVGQPLVVDPGSYKLSADAPGKTGWSGTVEVTRPGETTRFVIPALADVVVAPPPVVVATNSMALASVSPDVVTKPAPAPASSKTVHHRGWAYALGGASIVALGVGAGFGIHARSQWQASRDPSMCDAAGVCSQSGVSLIESARSSARISTVAFAAGGVLAVATGIAWWVSPTERSVGVSARF